MSANAPAASLFDALVTDHRDRLYRICRAYLPRDPDAALVDAPVTLLVETQRMHYFSQRRNKLTTKLLLFALGLFFIS